MADKQSTKNPNTVNDEARRCTYCGAEAPLIWVHGHGQCANCGINVQECCQGETCQID